VEDGSEKIARWDEVVSFALTITVATTTNTKNNEKRFFVLG
jgi:hypothetical protein